MRFAEAGALVTRRLLVGAAAFACVLPAPTPLFAAEGLSRSDVAAKLSRVPIFAVTNSEAAPYLTEIDGAGRRSGFLYISPQLAAQELNDIRQFDPRASLNVVSLDDVFFDISATAEEAAAAPQPKAGTSTDLRLFRLRPLDDEVASATRLSGALQAGAVPLFYEPSLRLPVEDGVLQTPFFFRFGDLQTAFETQKEAGGASALNDPPQPRVATLAELVRGLERGDVGQNVVFVAASEAAAVVARMNGADQGANGQAASGAADRGAAGRGAADRGVRERDPFFLSVPFANGRKG